MPVNPDLKQRISDFETASDERNRAEAAIALSEYYQNLPREIYAAYHPDGRHYLIAAFYYQLALMDYRKIRDGVKIRGLRTLLVELQAAFLAFFEIQTDNVFFPGKVNLDDLNELNKRRDHWRDNLRHIFNVPGLNFDAIALDELNRITTDINAGMHDFISYLIADTVAICSEFLGDLPCRYCFIGFGSMADKFLTPYSDIEFALLLEHFSDETRRYFIVVVQLIHLRVILLGETTPKIMLKDDDYEPIPRSIFALPVINGLSFDGAGEGGNKTPLGFPGDAVMMGTVAMLMKGVGREYKGAYQTQSTDILHSEYITGEQTLWLTYQGQIQLELNGLRKRVYQDRIQQQINADLDRFQPVLGREIENGQREISFKHNILRLPAIILRLMCLIRSILPSTMGLSLRDKVEHVMQVATAERIYRLLLIAVGFRSFYYLIKGDQTEDVLVSDNVEQGNLSFDMLRSIYKVLTPWYEAVKIAILDNVEIDIATTEPEKWVDQIIEMELNPLSIPAGGPVPVGSGDLIYLVNKLAHDSKYLSREHLKRSLESAQKALVAYTNSKLSRKGSMRIATLSMHMAVLLSRIGEYQDADVYYQQAVKTFAQNTGCGIALGDLEFVNSVLQTYKLDLSIPLRRFSDSLDRVANNKTPAWIGIKDYYVTPCLSLGMIEDRQRISLAKLMNSFLRESSRAPSPIQLANSNSNFMRTVVTKQHRVYLIAGDPGMGKSCALFWMQQELWKLRDNNDRSPIPVYIDLSKITPKDLHPDFIINSFKIRGFSGETSDEIFQNYSVVFLLDALDELLLSLGVFKDFISQWGLQRWNGFTIITCRKRLANYCEYLAIDERYSLCGFDDPQKEEYLEKAISKDPSKKRVYHTIEPHLREPSLWALISTPLLLFMLVDCLSLIENVFKTKEGLTRYLIYEIFTYKWFQREFVKLINEPAYKEHYGRYGVDWHSQLLQFAMRIACHKQLVGADVVNEDWYKTEVNQFIRDLLKGEGSYEVAERLRNACPLKVTGENQFDFAHRSFQEFLVAKALNEYSKLAKGFIFSDAYGFSVKHYSLEEYQAGLEYLNLSGWNKFAICKEIEIVRFLADLNPCPHRLLMMIDLSRNVSRPMKYYISTSQDPFSGRNIPNMLEIHFPWDGRRGSPVAQAAGNALTLFSFCGNSGAGLNFDDVHIINADISGGLFSAISARRSIWRDILAAQVQFRNADFTDAVTNFNFCEWPSHNAKKIVNCIASFDGNRRLSHVNRNIVAVGYESGEIILLDTVTFETIQTWKAHENGVNAFQFDEMNRKLLTVGGDGFLKLWDMSTAPPKELANEILPRKEKASIASSKNYWIVEYKDTEILLIDKNSNDFKKQLRFKTAARTSAVSTYQQYLFVAHIDGYVAVWELKHPLHHNDYSHTQLNWQTYNKHITTLFYDGEILACGCGDSTIQVWNFSSEPKKEYTLDEHTGTITGLQIKDRFLISTSFDNSTRVWDINTGVCLRNFTGHTNAINDLEVIDEYIITGGFDGTVRRWQYIRNTCLPPVKGHIRRYTIVHFTGHNTILSANHDGGVLEWNLHGEQQKDYRIEQSIDFFTLVDDKVILSDKFGKFNIKQYVSDYNDYSPVKVITDFANEIFSLAFNQQYIAAGTTENRVKVWHMNGTGYRPYLELEYVDREKSQSHKASVAVKHRDKPMHNITAVFLCDDHVAAGDGAGSIYLWDLSVCQYKGQCEMLTKVPLGHGNKEGIQKIYYTKQNMLSADRLGNIFYWHKAPGNYWKKSMPFNAHQGKKITSMSFYDEKMTMVISIDDAGQIILWDVGTRRILDRQLCSHHYSSAIDLENGRFVLGLKNGGIVYSAVRPPQYFALSREEKLPPWHIVWRTGQAPRLDLRGMTVSDKRLPTEYRQLFFQRQAKILYAADPHVADTDVDL